MTTFLSLPWGLGEQATELSHLSHPLVHLCAPVPSSPVLTLAWALDLLCPRCAWNPLPLLCPFCVCLRKFCSVEGTFKHSHVHVHLPSPKEAFPLEPSPGLLSLTVLPHIVKVCTHFLHLPLYLLPWQQALCSTSADGPPRVPEPAQPPFCMLAL